MQVNGTEIATDRRTSSMPFAGLLFESHTIPEMTDIAITGNPQIARHVDLIDEELRGWNCGIIYGNLMPILLPFSADQDREQILARRQQYLDQPEQFSWYTADGEIRSGARSAMVPQQHIQYQRPLLDGESLSYEFFYEADQQEVHPSIGRIAVLLRPEGAKLRWLPQGRSLESLELDPLNEVAPDEVLGSGALQLHQGQWNTVELTADGDRVRVAVNGEPVCSLATSIDKRPGLLGEQGRGCRVRAMRLSGPWPETLPDNLLELR